MACPSCKDVFSTTVNSTARGFIKPVVLTQKHLCGALVTTIQTEGSAKQAKQVTVHSCTMGAGELANCCK